MLVLGISALDNHSCVTLIEGDRVLASIAEERLTRVKMQAGFPTRAIAEVFRMTGRSPREVDAVAYPSFEWQREAKQIGRAYAKNVAFNARTDTPLNARIRHQLRFSQWAAKAVRDHRRCDRELDDGLARLGLGHKLERVEHHLAHHASAFYCSPYDRALICSFDWHGGGLAGAIAIGSDAGIERLHAFDSPHSMGLFYAQVTEALGFKVSRHEGKLVGLAAYGDKAVLRDRVRARFKVDDGDFQFESAMDDQFAKELSGRYRREDVAAAFQSVLEDVLSEVVAYYVDRYETENLVLAGSVAANVKLNQRLRELDGVRGLYVHQAMGDDGTGTGAALWVARQAGALSPNFSLPDAYLGPEYTDAQIREALDLAALAYTKPRNLEKAVAEKIASGKVVARFDGRMEYGPRALGNRSILYHCRDRSVNTWLNERLQRTEFMPFAPVTLYEDREKCYKNIVGAEAAALFMTCTFDCTDYFRETAPAATHVDGTARPQLVTEAVNPSYYKIINEYKKLTGFESIINTSFNMQEEPIVCTPEDAVRAYKLGHLDALAIGRYWVVNPG